LVSAICTTATGHWWCMSLHITPTHLMCCNWSPSWE
jgi:hypothetical protein